MLPFAPDGGERRPLPEGMVSALILLALLLLAELSGWRVPLPPDLQLPASQACAALSVCNQQQAPHAASPTAPPQRP